MIDVEERVGIARQRLTSYKSEISDRAGYSGAVVAEMGKLAVVAPEAVSQIAVEFSFEPDILSSIYIKLGEATHELPPLVEARAVAGDESLSTFQRDRRYYGIVMASADLDADLAVEVAREIKGTEKKVDALLGVFDNAEIHRSELLWEAFGVTEAIGDQARRQNTKRDALRKIAQRARSADLALTEKICDSLPEQANGIGMAKAVGDAIRGKNIDLVLKGREIVVRTLSKAVENWEKSGIATNSYYLDPLRDSVAVLHLFERDDDTHHALLSIISRAAQAKKEFSIDIDEDRWPILEVD